MSFAKSALIVFSLLLVYLSVRVYGGVRVCVGGGRGVVVRVRACVYVCVVVVVVVAVVVVLFCFDTMPQINLSTSWKSELSNVPSRIQQKIVLAALFTAK